MSMVSCLPKPSGIAILGDRQISYEDVELEWIGECDSKVERYCSSLLGSSKIGKIVIDIHESQAGLPNQGMDESYVLRLDEKIGIEAKTTWGGLRAIATLYQLASSGELSRQLEITDRPRFGWRGLLIDVARSFVSIGALRRILDGMAFLKLNVLHLHLSDDQGFRFRSEAFPGLASTESYSQAELEDLVSYAGDLGVRIIPELDVPGHVTSWLVNYPEWGFSDLSEASDRFGVHKACLDPSNEQLYEDLEILFSEVGAIFPEEFLHVGGDEVHPEYWSKSERVQKFAGETDLGGIAEIQNYFSNRLFEILLKINKKPLAWDEVLHEEVSDYVIQNWRGSSTRDRALVKGLDCIFSSGFYLDLFYPAEVHYLFDPESEQVELLELEDRLAVDLRFKHVAGGLKWTEQWRKGSINLHSEKLSGQKQLGRVLGGEACLWGELVSEGNLFPRLWSRLPAIAERLWSSESEKDVKSFYSRFLVVKACKEINWDRDEEMGLLRAGLNESQLDVAKLFEPAKWYFRLLGEEALNARLHGSEMPIARPYDVNASLDRVVDYLSPESFSARFLDEDLNTHALSILLERWLSLEPEDWPEDMQKGIVGLVEVARRLRDYLWGDQLTKDEVRYLLEELYGPHGEYVIAVVPPILKWPDSRESP